MLPNINIEPTDRNGCLKPCHLEKCLQREKCINNIKPLDVINKVNFLFNFPIFDKVIPEHIKLSGYCVTFNAIKFKIPFVESILNHLEFFDEVVVVDGNSTDGTLEKLRELAAQNPKLKVYVAPWDYNNPAIMGRQKSDARSRCTNKWLWQFDCDEFVPEWQYDTIRNLIANHPYVILFDIPVVTFYGGMMTTGRTENFFKWRLSKNIPGIIHGVHSAARQYDENGKMFFAREVSDSCEYIWENTGEIVERQPPLDKRLWKLNLSTMDKELPEHMTGVYSELISEACNKPDSLCVYHYSWVDYERKAGMTKFWSQQKRHYATDGSSIKEGKIGIDTTEEQIKETIKKFYTKKVFPLNIKKHPKHILALAKAENWCQHEEFTEGK